MRERRTDPRWASMSKRTARRRSRGASARPPIPPPPPGTLWRRSPIVLATVAVAALAVAAVAVVWVLDVSRTPSPAVSGAAAALPREKPAERINAIGRLLIPIDAGLSLVTLPDRAIREIVPTSRSGAVTGAQWSPDGRSSAYAFYHLRAGDSASSSEIFLTDFASEPRILVGRDRPGTVIESPAWAPDGQRLYFSYSALEGQRLVRRIERLDLATQARTVITRGVMPTVSPDGSSLAFVKGDGGGDSLAISDPLGGNVRTLVPSGRFSAVGPPRFSPDGASLAVPLSLPAGQANAPTRWSPFGLLAPRAAFAHGDPWEAYVLGVGGGEPRRISRLVEDEVSLAWSADSSQLAIYGTRGLYLVRVDGTSTFALDRGGFGGIDWAP